MRERGRERDKEREREREREGEREGEREREKERGARPETVSLGAPVSASHGGVAAPPSARAPPLSGVAVC